MKLKLSAAMVSLAIMSACGGSGSDEVSVPKVNTEVNPVVEDRNAVTPGTADTATSFIANEDRTRPAAGSFFSSSRLALRSNGGDLFADDGPQEVNPMRVASWPGLRYGDFLVSNNPWNGSAATWPLWYQEISLYDNGSGWGVQYDWDWGAETDTRGSTFNTKSYPEIIFGTKSPGERSGTFAETGLPVEIFDAPEITIDYAYSREGRRSDSATPGGTDSEYNVAIESFYHETCDVKRAGLSRQYCF